MKQSELTQIIKECCNDVLFIYNGKKSGVTSTVEDSVPTFQVWHGDNIKEYNTVEDVMSDPFYSGKSINDLIGTVDFTFA